MPSRMFALQLVTLALAAVAVQQTAGHGMMMDPPNRSSMWRFGFNTPPNYSDNEMYCGGYGIQHGVNGGHCGECGDNWAQARPRDNENGGKYGTGIIAKTYKSGELIKTVTKLSANHAGWFEYNLCVLDSPKALETDECFEQHLLKMDDGTTRYTPPRFQPGDYTIMLQLPEGLKCERCVLRWHYYTGNTWGTCEDGTSNVGCGPQETFRSCTDIAIE